MMPRQPEKTNDPSKIDHFPLEVYVDTNVIGFSVDRVVKDDIVTPSARKGVLSLQRGTQISILSATNGVAEICVAGELPEGWDDFDVAIISAIDLNRFLAEKVLMPERRDGAPLSVSRAEDIFKKLKLITQDCPTGPINDLLSRANEWLSGGFGSVNLDWHEVLQKNLNKMFREDDGKNEWNRLITEMVKLTKPDKEVLARLLKTLQYGTDGEISVGPENFETGDLAANTA